MTSPEQQVEPLDYERARMDTLCALPAFEYLLELTMATCLSDPATFTNAYEQIRQRPITPEGALLHRLGGWGLRTALDWEQNSRDGRPTYYSELLNTARADDVLREPQNFSDSILPEVAHKIEAFGKAIIDEAFNCLGEDAPAKVEAYKQASTATQKAAILQWLSKRVEKIAEADILPSPAEAQPTSDQAQPEDGIHYHPLRLSPKVIGNWPAVNVSPTCLGVSILVASFLEKAGVDYLHGGVYASEYERLNHDLLVGIFSLTELNSKGELPIPVASLRYLDSIFDAALSNSLGDRGYHAAIAARLGENNWMQIDPNYRITERLGVELPEVVEAAHDQLQLLASLGTSGNQMDVVSFSRFVMPSTLIVPEMALDTHDLFNEQLPTQTDEEFMVSLRKVIMTNLLTLAKNNSWLEVSLDNIPRLYGVNLEDYIYDTAQTVIEEYIFEDSKKPGVLSCIQRCRKDERYRERRVEDAKGAVLYALLEVFYEVTRTVNDHPMPMGALEVGLPHYRIGAAVLSDFAVYCGSELPASFWQTYWPSYTVATEHIATPEASLVQQQKTKQLLQLANAKLLHYSNKRVTVMKFLEQLKDVPVSLDEGGDTIGETTHGQA